MHAGLMPNGRVVFLDKVENYTQIKLPNGQYAYSAEYDPETNKVVGIQYYVGVIALRIHSVVADRIFRPMLSALVEPF